jgi:hypothetical protein
VAYACYPDYSRIPDYSKTQTGGCIIVKAHPNLKQEFIPKLANTHKKRVGRVP